MKSRARKVFATGVVGMAIAIGIASASITRDGDFVANPPVVIIPTAPGTPMTLGEDLTNTSANAGNINSLDDGGCTDFTATLQNGDTIPGTYPNGDTLSLLMQCNPPNFPTLRRCRYRILDGGGVPAAHFTALCKVSNSVKSITGSPLDFTNVGVGSSSTMFSTMSSQDDLTAISVWPGDNDDTFSIAAPCGTTAVPGCTDSAVSISHVGTFGMAVTCHPTKPGLINTQIMLVGNTGAQGFITVKCNGTTSTTSVTAMPSMVTSRTSIGTPVSTPITIKNPSAMTSVTLEGFGLSPTNGWFGAFDPMLCPNGFCTIAPMGTRIFTVTYAPTTAGPDLETATINVMGGAPLQISLDGDVVGPPEITVTPTAISRDYTGMDVAEPIMIANDGDSPLKITGMSLTPSSGPWFVTPSPMCSNFNCTIAAHTTIGFSATYHATGAGSNDATIDLFSDDSDEMTTTISLHGTGSSSIDVMPTMSFSPPPVTVGQSSTSQTFNIFSLGAVPLALTGASFNDPSGYWHVTWPGSCPNGTCIIPTSSSIAVSAFFAPLAAGSDSQTLTINSDASNAPSVPITLDGVGVAADHGTLGVASPVTVTTPVNMAQSYDLALTNIGTGPLTITSIAIDSNVPQWTSDLAGCAAGCTLTNPNDSIEAHLVFTPTSIVDGLTSHLYIQASDGMHTVDLIGTGTGATVELDSIGAPPPTIRFNDLPVGATSSPFVITLRNNGNVATPSLALTAPSAYDVGGSFAINAHSSITIPIVCKPTSVGNFDGHMNLVPSGPLVSTTPNPFDITLQCSGTDTQLQAMPSPIQLGEMRVGSTRTVPITLSTVGQDLDITGGPSLKTQDPRLGLGAVSTLHITSAAPVTFDLAVDATTDGEISNQIDVTARDTVHIAVSGRVTTPAIQYPKDLDLGTYCIKRPTIAQDVAFTAAGTATIAMSVAPALEMPTSPFSLAYVAPTQTGYPFALPAGQSASVEVTPVVRDTAGDVTDRIVWTSDMPNESPAYTNLKAKFVAAGGAISPANIDFSTVPLRSRSMPHTITIANCDETAIALTGSSIDEPQFIDVSTMPLPAMLAPNETATITVQFAPTHVGPSSGTLTVESSVGELEVELVAAGIAGSGDNTEKIGFYACGCRTADPATGTPIIFAIVAVIARRRRRAA